MRSLKTYLDILRKKGLVGCWHEAKKAVWPLWLTRNRDAIERIQAERASRYLWRRYRNSIMQPFILKQEEMVSITESEKNIWVCWLQGREQAPAIVQRCLASMEHWAPDYNIRLITAENMFEFVRLPEHLVQRYESGRIPFAHFSDVLRVALLETIEKLDYKMDESERERILDRFWENTRYKNASEAICKAMNLC